MTSFASCCVLSYNRPGFLPQMIQSLAENAGAPFELIIHDDGSGDPTLTEWLYNMHAAGAISSLILNTPGHNQGQGIALNRMFSMAKGDPIIKLDHDLTFRPNWLAKVNEVLGDNVHQDAPRIGLLGLFHYLHEPVDSRKTIIAQRDGWQEHPIICGSGFALRRETWEALGPFQEHSDAFAEDNLMQHKVTNSERWVCGLPNEDLIDNHGFGVGPSTVVVDHGVVAKIHHGPYVFSGVS